MINNAAKTPNNPIASQWSGLAAGIHVMSVAKTRQKDASKRSLQGVSEHCEGLFNTVLASAIVNHPAKCISGYFIAAQFSKTDVEQWIEGSPFAKEPPTEKPEADSLYNELVNLLMHPRITLKELPQTYHELHKDLTHYAYIESNLYGVENLPNLKVVWQAKEWLFKGKTKVIGIFLPTGKSIENTDYKQVDGQKLNIIYPKNLHSLLKKPSGQPLIGLRCDYREQLVIKKPKADLWSLEVRTVIYSNNCRLPAKGYLYATRYAKPTSKDSFNEVEGYTGRNHQS